MSCVLRAAGPEFDVAAFLATSMLVPSTTYHRGEPVLATRPEGKKCKASGIVVSVSEAPWSNLPAQVADAEQFLRENRQELSRLRSFPGVEDMALDFPIYQRVGEKVWMQTDSFPASLVAIAGALGLGLELSIYPPATDESEDAV
jgi:hypothetical protein